MKVVVFNGSPRRNGNTARLCARFCGVLEAEGVATEIVQVGGKLVHGCLECDHCRRTGIEACVQTDDPFNEWFQKMRAADGIVLATPVFVGGVTSELKAVIDRACYISRMRVRVQGQDNIFKHKVAAPLIAVRRAGAMQAYFNIMSWFAISDMIVPTSSYFNFAFGLKPGDVEHDPEGLKTVDDLARNMAWLLRRVVDSEDR